MSIQSDLNFFLTFFIEAAKHLPSRPVGVTTVAHVKVEINRPLDSLNYVCIFSLDIGRVNYLLVEVLVSHKVVLTEVYVALFVYFNTMATYEYRYYRLCSLTEVL